MKYKLTDETKEYAGRTLHRIECVEPFGGIKVGDKGGWIEKEENLSQDGDAWIFGNAMVYGNTVVCGDANIAQGVTTSMCIRSTEEFYEYQSVMAELQAKWDKKYKE